MKLFQYTVSVPQFCVLSLACLGILVSSTSNAQPEVYESGVHYQELAHPLPDFDPERYEVLELFWYGCPTCYDLLPTLQIWESSYRSTDMNSFRLPVVWNPAMEVHARVYLTAEQLGLLPEAYSIRSDWQVTPSIHNAIFEAIHEQGNPLRTAEDAHALFEAWGVSEKAFAAAWDSEAVAAKLNALNAMQGLSEIPRLPALVLNGRYVVTLSDAVTSSEDLYKILNFLLVRTREEKRAASR